MFMGIKYSIQPLKPIILSVNMMYFDDLLIRKSIKSYTFAQN